MDCALPEVGQWAPDEDREARIALRTDARCLEQTLLWFRRSYLMVPGAVLWAWLAWRAGAGLWALGWFFAWATLQIYVRRLAVRLHPDARLSAQAGLRRTTRAFWAAGCLYAVLCPVFFIGTDIETKLTATLLATWITGVVVISSSGVRLAYAGVMSPPTLAVAAGWVSHGGVLGYGLTALYLAGLVAGFAAVLQQRRSWEALVRLLDDNEALAASLKAERDRAEAASASKTRFFAAASHDLRQPLHALSINATTLELLARRSNDPVLQEVAVEAEAEDQQDLLYLM